MTIYYEVLNKNLGYSRIGRMILSKDSRLYVNTPNIVIPFEKFLSNNINFLDSFTNQEIFRILDKEFLNKSFLGAKFKNVAFIYSHQGIITKFADILQTNEEFFKKNNLIPMIPFNVPSTTINMSFAKQEIKNYLTKSDEILKSMPNVNFGLTIKLFQYPHLLELYSDLINKNSNVKIVNFSDLFDYLKTFRDIINVIVKFKQDFDNNLILMCSGKVLPKIYPFLVYIGIDLIDPSYLLFLSSEKYYDTIEHLIPFHKLKYLTCSCNACKYLRENLNDSKEFNGKIKFLSLHNLISAKNYMQKIKQYMKTEDFRSFVEKSSFDDMDIISMLKILDRQFFKQLKYETPISEKNKKIKCLGPSSYWRPDFQLFRERVLQNFEPEPWTKLILLFPCSAKKPYSESKSHKKFLQVLRKFPEFPDFQEFILTSPLGVIPRQLENIYPVNSYDISVTGYWDEEEINITKNMLIEIIKMYDSKIPIICHVPEVGYAEIIRSAKPEISNPIYFTTIDNSVTSVKSLQSLYEMIIKFKDNYPLVKKNHDEKVKTLTLFRKINKILDFQFGKGIGCHILPKKIRIKPSKGKNFLDVYDKEKDVFIGRFYLDSGKFYPSLKIISSIKNLFKERSYLVFNGNKLSGTTLYRPGIKEFSDDLNPNSIAFLFDEYKENIIACVEMIVGSNFIKNSNTGRIARIYEKNK
ncbi:MAG: DUF5591 domain-containing protein [Promethearchaeota archaeon]